MLLMERAILHSDLNCFYASVEMMLDPSLRGKAVAVCGSTEDRHGIVLAKSEKAKKAGVKTGMVNWEARQQCPDLIVVPPQYDQYLKYSKLTQAIYQRYTDLIEPFGMDECWLDVTGSRMVCGDAMTIAENIRRSVREELGLTVSIGVSYNKIFAKLGSDMKKPDAITEICKDTFKDKVWPLDCSEMIYCGRATTAKLAKYCIYTIGDIAQTDPNFLKQLLGVNGLALWRYANGTDTSRVMHKDFVSPVKSVGHGITCIADLETEEEVWKVILSLCQDILSLKDWLWSSVSSWISGIWTGIKNFFGIHSPSKQMGWIGEMLVRGLSDSIDDNADEAVTSAKNMSKDILSSFDDLNRDLVTTVPAEISAKTSAPVYDFPKNSTPQFTIELNISNFNNYGVEDIRQLTNEVMETANSFMLRRGVAFG